MVFAEAHSNLGQADLVIAHRGVTWVIEIKVAYKGQNPETKEGQGFRQIETKNYAKPYPDAVSVVLVIDDETRQIIF
jgi:hypothetical protein